MVFLFSSFLFAKCFPFKFIRLPNMDLSIGFGGAQQQMHVDFKPALDDAGGADVHVVNVRTAATLSDEADGAESAAAAAARPQQRVSLLVQRLGFDCCRRADGVNASTGGGRFSVDRLFPDYFGQHIRATTLTSLQPGPPLQKSFVLGLKPMELYAFELQP